MIIVIINNHQSSWSSITNSSMIILINDHHDHQSPMIILIILIIKLHLNREVHFTRSPLVKVELLQSEKFLLIVCWSVVKAKSWYSSDICNTELITDHKQNMKWVEEEFCFLGVRIYMWGMQPPSTEKLASQRQITHVLNLVLSRQWFIWFCCRHSCLFLFPTPWEEHLFSTKKQILRSPPTKSKVHKSSEKCPRKSFWRHLLNQNSTWHSIPEIFFSFRVKLNWCSVYWGAHKSFIVDVKER